MAPMGTGEVAEDERLEGWWCSGWRGGPKIEEVASMIEEIGSPKVEGVVDEERMQVVTEGKKHAVDVHEVVVGERLRFSLQHIISPFMAEVKRRTFVDGMFPNLFQEVVII